MLLSVIAALLLGACHGRGREIQVEIPPHNTTAPSPSPTYHY